MWADGKVTDIFRAHDADIYYRRKGIPPKADTSWQHTTPSLWHPKRLKFFSEGGLMMGIGCRILLIHGNDSLERISMSRLERLLHFDRVESLLLYAGRRVRFAMVFVDVPGRQVLTIRNINYFLLPFNDKGRTDKKEWEKRLRLAMELPARLLKVQPPKQIVDVRHRIAKRGYEHEFQWKESRKVEEAIVAAIFKFGVTKL